MNTKTRKYFGTDGIRGIVGEGVITPDFIMKLGWAAGRVLAKKGNGPVLVGKDTRISGYMFESALEAGLSAAGVDIRLLGPMPTPGIAYLTKSTRAQAGIVISASHNPFYDNGIKFFAGDGTKLPDQVEHEIEYELNLPMETVHSRHLGRARRITDAPRRYIEFCKSKVEDVDFNGLRIVVDCANGATYHIAPKVFEELGAEVISHAATPDGLNINDECGATSPEALQKLVKESRADLGIALDGDGDRLIMIDHEGNLLDGDDILYVIAQLQKDKLNGAVVGTVMSNLGLEHAIKDLDLNFFRAAVGDRYVMDLLRKEKLILGGETSGHIINLDLATTGDGIIAALQVLEEMVISGKKLSELVGDITKFPQIMKNVKLSKKIDIASNDDINNAVKDVEQALGDSGRVVLRPSGTEPLVRVMVEGEQQQQVEMLVDQLVTKVEEVVNNLS
ncbi:MAG TPA: phosphoglucosamine mutase [Thiotrichaceae bacterium]|nr:phosphoglucosamine mutase [Thiotrichaceae bacterium]HIM07635.1 phosphoglucosamine mutase [Gammaproteobacteria bacterium]